MGNDSVKIEMINLSFPMSDLIPISMSDFNPLIKIRIYRLSFGGRFFFQSGGSQNKDVSLQINKQKQVPCPISVFLVMRSNAFRNMGLLGNDLATIMIYLIIMGLDISVQTYKFCVHKNRQK